MEIKKEIVRVILFDLWGTLAWIKKGEIYLKIQNQLGFGSSLIKAIDQEIICCSTIKIAKLKFLFKKAKIKVDEKEIRKLHKILTHVSDQEYRLYSDTKIVPRLKQKYQLGIISNIIPSTAKRVKRKLASFFENFDHLIFSCDLGIAKPDKKIYQFACQKFNIKPKAVLMVGNSLEDDVLPARKLGIQAVLITRNNKKKKGIKSLFELESLL